MIGQVLLWSFAVIGGLAVLVGGAVVVAGIVAVAFGRALPYLSVAVSDRGEEEFDQEDSEYLQWLESDLWGREDRRG